MIQVNPLVGTQIANVPSNRLVIYVILKYFVELHYSKRGSPSMNGLFSSFILQLSSTGSLAPIWNEIVTESVVISQIPVFSGTYADLIFVCISQILIDSKEFQPIHITYAVCLKNM